MAGRHNIQQTLEGGMWPTGGVTVRTIAKSGKNRLISYGTTVPDGLAGYAVGGNFINTSTGTNYINAGTVLVSSFSTVSALTTMTLTGASATVTLSGASSTILLSGANSTLKLTGVGANLWVGTFHSTDAGTGVVLGTLTKALDVCCDDGGVALTAGSYRATRSRMLVTTAITTGDISIFGLQGQLKLNANVATTAHIGGLWGYVEVVAGKTIATNTYGVMAMLDMPATSVIGTGKTVGAIGIVSNDINCTHTGKAACIVVEAPLAGTWDYLLQLEATTGVTDATAHGTTASGRIAIRHDTTVKYLHMFTD